MKIKIKLRSTLHTITDHTDKLFSPPQRLALVNSIFVFIVMGFIAGTFLKGCGKAADQKIKHASETTANIKQDLKNVQAEYRAEWQTFKNESENNIGANEKRIEAFKVKMETAGTKLKTKYGKDVAVLEQKNHDLKRKLEEYQDEGQSAWEEFKTNFKHDMDGLRKTMTDVFKDNG